MSEMITAAEFRTLLDLYMVSDPWPLSYPEQDQVRAMLDRIANDYKPGQSWVEAYHYFHPDRYGRRWWLTQYELCSDCGQPKNPMGDCNHERLGDVSSWLNAGELV